MSLSNISFTKTSPSFLLPSFENPKTKIRSSTSSASSVHILLHRGSILRIFLYIQAGVSFCFLKIHKALPSS
ncbi:hypothetical protein Bca101_035698 [Brassica carinata]